MTDVDRTVVRYDNAFALMQDLRRMGATNVLNERRRTPSRRATFVRMAQVYAERFADPDGLILAPPSTLSGCRDGPRMTASRNR